MQRLMIITHLGLGMHLGSLRWQVDYDSMIWKHFGMHLALQNTMAAQSNDAEIANPTMLHDGSGMGAMVGAMAAFLAEDGFQGAPAITVEQASEYWSDLGTNYTINQNYIKPYPICRWAHAAIDALGSILDQHDLDNQDIAHIEVRTFSQAAALFQGMPDTSSQAQYSLPFALAVRLLHGEIAPDHIQGPALGDPQIKSILAKINVSEVEKHARRFPAGRWSDVTVTLKNGDVLHSGDIHARGGQKRQWT